MTLQPTMNVDELLSSQKTDEARKAETAAEVGKTDKTEAKAELEELVHDDTALNGQTAENFVKTNTVKAGGKSTHLHSKWAIKQAKVNDAMKQKVAELKQQQKANLLKEWTLVDKPTEELSEAQRKAAEDGGWTVIDGSGEEIVTDSDVWKAVEELDRQVKDEETKATESKKTEEGVKTEDKTKTEGEKKPEGETKTENKTKTEGEKKPEGEAKTENETKTEGEKKPEGEAKTEGEKKAEAAAKSDGDIKTWFDKHPRFKLAMVILEQILDAVIGVMSSISSKLPAGVGGCITGGLSVIKGLAGFHKLDSIEKDLGTVIKDVKKGGEQIAEGIAAMIPDPSSTSPSPNSSTTAASPCKAAQIINCVGTMCGELSGAKSWEDALNAVGKSAADIVSATNPESSGIASAVKTNMGNFTKAIFRGVREVETAIKNSDATNDEKTMKALEMFKKTLAEDASLSEDEKNLVKALSDGAIKSIKAKGSKKTLEAYEETLGAAAGAILKGRNKEIAEKTLALMREIRAEQDPFKAALNVLDKAKAIAGGESKEIEVLKEAVADAGKTVEKTGTAADESSVQKDVGSFQDRLKNLEALMKKGQS